jgi:menaquinone-dependent protoporphyrinogen oxidase
MGVLVTWASKRGGTEGIGRVLGSELGSHGLEVVALPVCEVVGVDSYDAVIIGGALYGNRWLSKVRHFVSRHTSQLRKVPVWFFSSGPLDDSAERESIPATSQVAVLAERVGAKGHVTFGGRLERDASGFPASAMAEKRSGDWRKFARARARAAELAAEIPRAVPGTPIDHPAHAYSRLAAHAVVGWVLCAASMAALLKLVSLTAALALHAILASLIFTVIAWHYFRARGAREAIQTAIVWATIDALLDLVVVAGVVQHSLAIFMSLAGTWLPLGLIFIATWITGEVMLMALAAGTLPAAPKRG